MSFIDCCRLCLKDLTDVDLDEEGHFMLDEPVADNRTLQQLIEECFQIVFAEIETISKVCGSCYDDALSVDKMRKRFHDADVAIKSYYSQMEVKEEFLEDYLDQPVSTSTLEIDNEGLYDTEYADCKNNILIIEDSESLDKAEPAYNDDQEEDYHKFKFIEVDHQSVLDSETVEQSCEEDSLAKLPKPKPKRRYNKRSGKLKPQKSNPLMCYICLTDFTTREELDRHIPTHVGSVSKVCSVCKLELTTVRHLNMHIRQMHFRKGKRIPCDACQKDGITREFSSNNKLQAHIKRVHEGIKEVPEQKYICTYCGKKFSRGTHLRMHENIHTKAIVYSCQRCTFTTNSRSGLIRHERVHTSEKPFKCDVCDAAFSQSNALHAHKAARHNKDRPFSCELCGENVRFKTKYILQNHMRIHEKNESGDVLRNSKKGVIEKPPERELKCSFCPAVYFKERFLCRHIIEKHPTEDVEMIPCEVCAEGNRKVYFLTQQEKDSHISAHPKIVPEKERSCKDCGESFLNIYALARHRQSHFIHDCDKCGKTFKKRAGLRLHYLTVHLNSRPYKCDKCDASYGQLTQLNAHLKSRH